MGTHGRKEPREPLNSPPRAKEFIYRLQPAERSSLLQELQNFQSRATAQGRSPQVGHVVPVHTRFYRVSVEETATVSTIECLVLW